MSNIDKSIKTAQLLKDLEYLISDLQSTGSSDDKVFLIRRHCNDNSDLTRLLKKIYDPRYILNITGDAVGNAMFKDGDFEPIYDLEELLDALHTRKITGTEAINSSVYFISQFSLYYGTILKILDKDLKCGIGAKSINKAIPNLITVFRDKVPLAVEFSWKDFSISDYQWFISQKLDGIRCLCFIGIDSVDCYSRNGIRFETLDVIEQEIMKKWKGPRNIILDGELCKFVGDKEDFQDLTTEIRRKNHSMTTPKFMVFDMYTISNFEQSKANDVPYSVSYGAMSEYLEHFEHISVLPQKEVHTVSQFEDMYHNKPEDWEGFILRRGDRTVFKRSKSLLKVKTFKEEDFEVMTVHKGTKYIDGEEQDCISSLGILYKGCMVGVGSGLTDKQRLDWYRDPNLIIGKIITVKYFSESKTFDGVSLRFPTLKCVRDYE